MMRAALILAALLPVAALGATPKDYPTRPVRMIVPNTPGSSGDILGRIAFAQASAMLNQQIVVDNRPGAGGAIGLEILTRSEADGYTFGTVTLGSMVVAPQIYRNWKVDTFRDFAPVTIFVNSETALLVNARLPVKSVQDYIALAKQRGGTLNMASAGFGSTSHLGNVLFNTLAGVSGTQVPYKGGGPSMLAVATGESDVTVGPLAAGWNHVKAGRMRLIATGGTRRAELTPDVPTIAESGVPGFEYYGWNGVIAPKNTPRAMLERFNAVLVKALQSAETRSLFVAQGEVPAWSTPAEYARTIRRDYDRLGKVIKQANLRAD